MSEYRCRFAWRSPDLLDGLRLRRGVRGLRQGSHDGAAREIDLEGVVLKTLGVAQQKLRRAFETCGVGGLAAKRGFGFRIAPGLVRDAAERQPRLFDGAAIHFESCCDRYQREGVGKPVAD